jgi:hypothetical protein
LGVAPDEETTGVVIVNAVTINGLVSGLGRTYGELIADGLLQEGGLSPLFTEGDNEELIQKPAPFAHRMDQATTVRTMLGEPYRSKGPAKLPPPIGVTGGWDAYRLARAVHTNAEVVIQFSVDTSASGIAFRLINRGHE